MRGERVQARARCRKQLDVLTDIYIARARNGLR